MDFPFRRRRKMTKEQEGAVAALKSIYRPKEVVRGVHGGEDGVEDYVLLLRSEGGSLGFFLRRDGRLEEMSSGQLAEASSNFSLRRGLLASAPARPATAP